MIDNKITTLTRKASGAKVLRLFLDYDGTLARFAPSPDTVLPDAELISIIRRLVSAEGILPAVISGRRLSHIQELLPVEGLLKGGTYGIEMELTNGKRREVLPYDQIRPAIEQLIPRWQAVIGNKKGFYLEDKGWALALHGRFAEEKEIEPTISAANQAAKESMDDPRFHIFLGDRFLEYAPIDANKAVSVRWVLDELTPKNALTVYIGDDDKDEDAFSVINENGGFSVRVSANPTNTLAHFRMSDPAEVRTWLGTLLRTRGA